MFDSNAMQELAALSRDRYQRAGGGGAHKVYASSKAYYDARGHNEQSAWDRLLVETKHRWRFAADTAAEHFRIACLTSQEGLPWRFHPILTKVRTASFNACFPGRNASTVA